MAAWYHKDNKSTKGGAAELPAAGLAMVETASIAMGELDEEIRTFQARRAELEKHHNGKWVVVSGSEFVGAYDSFDTAAAEAVRRFGRGPYLIRQVGAPDEVLPASVMYHPINAAE